MAWNFTLAVISTESDNFAHSWAGALARLVSNPGKLALFDDARILHRRKDASWALDFI